MEIKWGVSDKARLPVTFRDSYRSTRVDMVDRENVGEFLLGGMGLSK